jgi:hypothetical protein
MRAAAIILLVLILSACAKEDFWYQEGKMESEMHLALYECRVDLRDKYGFFGDDQKTPAYMSALRECMTKKGYSLPQEPKK